jgi:hypothetical protein
MGKQKRQAHSSLLMAHEEAEKKEPNSWCIAQGKQEETNGRDQVQF